MSLTPRLFGTAQSAVLETGRALRMFGHEIQTDTWQGMTSPPPMLELLEVGFRIPIAQTSQKMALDVKPNLPWADEHFEERVSGKPSNPGESWKRWPYYPKGEVDNIIRKNELFSHTYQERIWPKQAGAAEETGSDAPHRLPRQGIRFMYGDLIDVVNLLVKDPHTRQAYLPIWFPEDTGATHGGRVPCTLGYLFMMRNGYMHCTYYIRSCDYFRHFRDDIYLAARLTIWIVDRIKGEFPDRIVPGFLNMHIGNLHCWANERGVLPQ